MSSPRSADLSRPRARVGILTGVTASGKTSLALEFAATRIAAGLVPIEIVNADSLLVYRGMDIGTAKPAPADLARTRHHLVDVRDPDQPFNAGDFARLAIEAIDEIEARGNRALVVGGTGFYLKALLRGTWEGPSTNLELRARLSEASSEELYRRLEASDPASASRIGRQDRYRLVRSLELIELGGRSPSELEAARAGPPDPRFTLWILDRPDAELDARIEKRTTAMLESGLVEESSALRARYPAARALGAVGYAQTIRFLDGIRPPGRKIPPGLSGLAGEIALATRQLVKKQRTWFRGQHPEGTWYTLDRDQKTILSQLNAIYRGED